MVPLHRGKIILQSHCVILGAAGIEKIGTFSRYIPAVHDWLPCSWYEPFEVKEGATIALHRDGVSKMAEWGDHVAAIIA